MCHENRLLPETVDRQPSVLDDPRQRQILKAVQTHGTIGVGELAAHLATESERKASESEIRLDLYHRCLPGLEAAGWIERDGDRVEIAGEFPFGTESPLPDLAATDDQFWRVVDAVVARPRRRESLSLLAEQSEEITVGSLATTLADRTDTDCDEQTARTLLHHVDLPTLAEVGLVSYDPEQKAIAPTSLLVSVAGRLGLAGESIGRGNCCDGQA